MGKESRGTVVRKDRDLQAVGPFNYKQSFVDKKSEPKFTMGAKLGSTLTPKGVVAPSPGAYDPNNAQSKVKYPEYKIGTSARGGIVDDRKAKLVPAPGAYDIKSKDFEGKSKFHMGAKLTFNDTQKYIHSLPGPGTHETSATVIKTKAPVFSMGAKIVSPRDTTMIVPGAKYDVSNS